MGAVPLTSEQLTLQELEDRKLREENLPYILAFLVLFIIQIKHEDGI